MILSIGHMLIGGDTTGLDKALKGTKTASTTNHHFAFPADLGELQRDHYLCFEYYSYEIRQAFKRPDNRVGGGN